VLTERRQGGCRSARNDSPHQAHLRYLHKATCDRQTRVFRLKSVIGDGTGYITDDTAVSRPCQCGVDATASLDAVLVQARLVLSLPAVCGADLARLDPPDAAACRCDRPQQRWACRDAHTVLSVLVVARRVEVGQRGEVHVPASRCGWVPDLPG
jgi:hypothetical protein